MKMKKSLTALAIAAAVVGLAGCSPSYEEQTDDFLLPYALSDCEIYRVSSVNTTLYVTRCPNSDTSTSWRSGKQQNHTFYREDDFNVQ